MRSQERRQGCLTQQRFVGCGFLWGALVLAAGCQGIHFNRVDDLVGSPPSDRGSNTHRTVEEKPLHREGSPPVVDVPAPARQPRAVETRELVAQNLSRGHREAAMNRPEQAEFYYRRVLDLEPENSAAHHRLAVIADKRRDYGLAERHYLAALRGDAKNPDLLSDLGYSYFLQGRHEECQRYLLTATRLDPSHSKALHNLSLVYASQGDYDRSFDALRRAVGESEARSKIARLFPNGRSKTPDAETVVASFQAAKPVEDKSLLPAGPADRAATSELLPHSSDALPPIPRTFMQPGHVQSDPAFGHATAPRGISLDRVPDSQINDVFAAIDRETPAESRATQSEPAATDSADLPKATTAPASPSTDGRVSQRVASSVRALSRDSNVEPERVAPTPPRARYEFRELQAPPGADPLASMPLWPSGEDRRQRRPDPAPPSTTDDSPSATPQVRTTDPQPSPAEPFDERAESDDRSPLEPLGLETPPESPSRPALKAEAGLFTPVPPSQPSATVPSREPQREGSGQSTKPDRPRSADALTQKNDSERPLGNSAATRLRIVPTGVLTSAETPGKTNGRDALGDYELVIRSRSTSATARPSQASAASGPLIQAGGMEPPAASWDSRAIAPSKSNVAPSSYEALPSLRIQPRRDSSGLFAPPDDPDAIEDFASSRDKSVRIVPRASDAPDSPARNGSGSDGPSINPRTP